MSEKQFDTVKGAFLLVAVVICVQMLIATIVVLGCVFGRLEGLLGQDACKSAIQPILEIFQMSFTAAIAFAGGRWSAPSEPQYKVPPEKKDDNAY